MQSYLKNPKEALHLIFNLDKPDSILSGISDGVSNLMTGVCLGVGGAASVITDRERRTPYRQKVLILFLYLFGGCAVGSACAVYQLWKGIWTYLSCLSKRLQGKGAGPVWNRRLKSWTSLNLKDAYEELPITNRDLEEAAFLEYLACQDKQVTNQSAQGEMSSGERVNSNHHHHHHHYSEYKTDDKTNVGSKSAHSSPTYYQLLRVPPSATRNEVTKAYRALALRKHPDRCGNTPSAIEEFQQINKAYETLSDAAKREEYNALLERESNFSPVSSFSPPTSTGEEGRMDSHNSLATFFHGSQLSFTEPLIGPLLLSLLAMPCRFFTHEKRQELQYRREIRVAHLLSEYVNAQSRSRSDFLHIISDVSHIPFGETLLTWIAEEYTRASDEFSSRLTWLMNGSNPLGFVKRGWRHGQLYLNVWRDVFSQHDSMSTPASLLNAAVLSLSENSIRYTVRQAALMVIYDTSATMEERKNRAKGLKELSSLIFEQCQTNRAVAAVLQT